MSLKAFPPLIYFRKKQRSRSDRSLLQMEPEGLEDRYINPAELQRSLRKGSHRDPRCSQHVVLLAAIGSKCVQKVKGGSERRVWLRLWKRENKIAFEERVFIQSCA